MSPQILIFAGVLVVALVAVPRLIEWWRTKRKPNATAQLVAEYQAMQTLHNRAKRLGCKELGDAVATVKECFMNGEKLGEEAAK